MRVLHLYKAYFPIPGGIEGHIRMLAEGQAAAGHHVTVLVTADPEHTESHSTVNGVEVVRCSARFAPASTPLSTEYFRQAARREADLVHVHSPYPPAELAALRAPAPYVLTYHAEVTR
ncbi:MAG: glycosyltransferase, partial [Chloroflexi bacterium]|nr:glycosyltransferase [Chloroflexota bacterium]